MKNLKKILCISHHIEPELGIINDFVLQNNFKAIIVYPLHNSFLPTNVDDYSGVIIFGGVMNVSDTKEYPGLLKELNWIESLLNSNIPVIGICLGAQLIAKAAGAIVSPHKDNLFEPLPTR